MNNCRWMTEVEKWFDGQATNAGQVESHIQTCTTCQKHLAGLKQLRRLSTMLKQTNTNEIRDFQLPAFIQGIHEGIDQPLRRPHRIWAIISITAAALIVAISTFLVLTNGTDTVDATVIESTSSDLDGATIRTYDTEDGVATVWITGPQEDVW